MNIIFSKSRLTYFGLIFFLLNGACHQQKRTEGNTLVYNQNKPITSLDPAFARSQANIWLVDHLFNCLTTINNNGTIVPSIANSWSISTDQLTYRFILRSDVFFHDDPCFGTTQRKVKSSDIVYSFSRLIDPQLGSPGSWIFKEIIDTLRPFFAVNDSTFELKLRKPFSALPGLLSMQYCSIVPAEAVRYYGKEFRNHPVGTGPFQFVKWIDGQGIFLKKNGHYFFKGRPYLDAVKITTIPDINTAFLELKNGNIDLMNGLESGFAYELLDEKIQVNSPLKDKIKFGSRPFLNTEYLGFNLASLPKDHPLQDTRIRQAIAYGIDRAGLLKVLRNGIGIPAHSGFCPRGLPGYNQSALNGYMYNPTLAKAILKQSEKKNISLVLNISKEYLDLCTGIARQLKEIGIEIKLEVMDQAALREGIRAGKISFFRGSWIGDYPDAENFLSVFYSKNGAPPNYTRFNDMLYDNLYEKSLAQPNIIQRAELYSMMEKIIHDHIPVIPLFYDQSAVIYSSRLKDYIPNPLNILKIEEISVEKNPNR